MRWTRLFAQTFDHGHRAECGEGLFEDEYDLEEHVFVDNAFVDGYL